MAANEVDQTRPRWWIEVPVAVLAYQAYRLTRIWVAGSTRNATIHARQIVRAERALHIFIESRSQRALLAHPSVLSFWNVYYGTVHFVVPLVVFVWLWRVAPDRYRTWRNIFGFLLLIGLIGFAVYPLLPPRLLPPSEHIIDTAARFGGLGSLGGPDANPGNPYAAMPSLHIGWSSWCTAALVPVLRRRWARALLVLYPLATLTAIVVTGNHYVLDAVGGLLALGAAVGIEQLRSRAAHRASS